MIDEIKELQETINKKCQKDSELHHVINFLLECHLGGKSKQERNPCVNIVDMRYDAVSRLFQEIARSAVKTTTE